MNLEWKRIISWLVVFVGIMGVALSYLAIYVLVAYFAAGIVGLAELALLVSGPMSGIGAALAYRKPRQKVAMTLGLLGLVCWVLLWVVCFAVLGFRFG